MYMDHWSPSLPSCVHCPDSLQPTPVNSFRGLPSGTARGSESCRCLPHSWPQGLVPAPVPQEGQPQRKITLQLGLGALSSPNSTGSHWTLPATAPLLVDSSHPAQPPPSLTGLPARKALHQSPARAHTRSLPQDLSLGEPKTAHPSRVLGTLTGPWRCELVYLGQAGWGKGPAQEDQSCSVTAAAG